MYSAMATDASFAVFVLLAVASTSALCVRLQLASVKLTERTLAGDTIRISMTGRRALKLILSPNPQISFSHSVIASGACHAACHGVPLQFIRRHGLLKTSGGSA
jgi:hypothetical protein